MSGTQLLQAIVDGVLTGGVYALMAAGLTLIFGVMDIINIAQGVMVVLGAYLSYELSTHLGIGLLPGLLLTVPAMFVLGVAIEFGFMRRLHESDRTGMSILVTFAVAILIEGILSAIYGVDWGAAVGIVCRSFPFCHWNVSVFSARFSPSESNLTGPWTLLSVAPLCR